MKKLTQENRLNILADYAGVSQAKLAKLSGYSKANFNHRAKRGSFSSEELEKIGKSVGAIFQQYFEFKNGKRI